MSKPVIAKAGAARFELYRYPRVLVNGEFQPNYAGALSATPDVVWDAQHQFQDAKLSISRDQFELKTQSSTKALSYIETGIEMMTEISLADISMESLSTLFSSSLISNAGKQKIVIGDRPGYKLVGDKLVIKPLVGSRPTNDPNEWITMPNAALVEINNTDLSFSLNNQRQLRLTFKSLPFYALNPVTNLIDDLNPYNGVRAIFGAENVPGYIQGFSAASTSVGSTISISGAGFTGATAVRVGVTAAAAAPGYTGGVAAVTFAVVDDNTLSVTIPAGATSGNVAVVVPKVNGNTFDIVSAASLTIA